ncbi:MAG: hypothetical protein AB7U05_05135 [Mangrovibacterium sp.]|tara:strand:- start:6584 stop:6739 length:156 start_codon:yes stop_codon:yes gene_type:complete
MDFRHLKADEKKINSFGARWVVRTAFTNVRDRDKVVVNLPKIKQPADVRFG